LPPEEPSEIRLPRSVDFSPTYLKQAKRTLGDLLELVATHSGDYDGMVRAIRDTIFKDHAKKREDSAERENQQLQLAKNMLMGMANYGLFDRGTTALTAVGEQIRAEPDTPSRNSALAQHILKSVHGIALLRAVKALRDEDKPATKDNLKSKLAAMYGMKLSTNATVATRMLQWLRESDVLDGDNINEGEVERLTGAKIGTADAWADLSLAQRAFLRALRHLAEARGTDPISAQEVRELAEKRGAVFDEGQLRSKIFEPLAEEGWLEISPPRSKGRGGKSGHVAATDQLLKIDLDILPKSPELEIPARVRKQLRTPLSTIYTDLSAADKNKKGLALELLAVRMALDLGLRPMGFRLTGKATGGAEVDLVADGAHLHFSRWLFQCKNEKQVEVSDLAKEVGLAVLLKAHVIVLVTTGRFRRSVPIHAAEIVSQTALQVVLVPASAITKYRDGGTGALTAYFASTAAETMRAKQGQLLNLSE
jgi:hypothetical protein